MAGKATLPTTKKRHEQIFNRYLELLKNEYERDPDKAVSLAKSYFYKVLAKEFNNAPSVIGRIVQLGFQASGSPPSRNKKAINKNEMDPQVRFILGYDEH